LLITTLFRDRIKKRWLYILFPTTIYDLGITYLLIIKQNHYVASILVLINAYYVAKIIKGTSLIDTLIIPALLIIILILLINT